MKYIVNARFLTQQITGVQRYAIEIGLRLKNKLGDDIIFMSPHEILQHDIASQLDAQIVGKHSSHLWEQLDLPLNLMRLGNPLLLCLCNTAPIFYKNKIVTVHDVAFELYPKSFSKNFVRLYKFMIPRVVRNSKHVVTVSNFSKDEIASIYEIDKEKISVIANAVSERFNPVLDEGLRKEKYFLAVSSLNYRKNFIPVLQAFKLLLERNGNYKLFVVGDIKNKSFSEVDLSEYTSIPNIKFLGRISDEDLIRYYSNAVGFVYPSLYEGFGIPPLESQKCGCPVLCSDIPVLHEVCGDSVMYCNPHDIQDIAEKMLNLAENKMKFREFGLNNVGRYSWEQSATKLRNVLEIYQ